MTEENRKQNGVRKTVSEVQANLLNPLAPKSKEKEEEIAKHLQEIRVNHGQVMRAVRRKFMGDALYFVDKG